MKSNTLKLLLALGLAFGSTSGHASSYHADISINPALYSGSLATPFLLDFQLISGGGAAPVSNSATISGFSFAGTGAGPLGPATTNGTVVGDLFSAVTLIDSEASPINEFFQGFSNGTTAIGFDINTTDNVNAAAAPDMLTVALLDSSFGNPQIPTTALDTLALMTITFNNPTQSAAYAGTGDAVGVTGSVSAVPVPAAAWLMGSALAGLGLFGRRKAA